MRRLAVLPTCCARTPSYVCLIDAIRAYGVLLSTRRLLDVSPSLPSQRFVSNTQSSSSSGASSFAECTGTFDVTELPARIQSELDHAKTAALLRHLKLPHSSGKDEKVRHLAQLTPDSKWTVSWSCRDCATSWTSRVSERCDNRVAMRFGCPSCASASAATTTTAESSCCTEGGDHRVANRKLVDAFPMLAVDWNTTANNDPSFGIDDEVDTVLESSPIKAWWSCSCCRRSWREAVFARVQRFVRRRDSISLALKETQEKGRKVSSPNAGNHCPRCEALLDPQTNDVCTPGTPLSQHAYLMSEVVLTSHQNPALMPLSGSNNLNWKCSYCEGMYKACLSDRYARAVHCPTCTGGQRAAPKAMELPPSNAIAITRPDVCHEISDRTLSNLVMRYMTPTDPRTVRFLCRTCLEPYQMTMHSRCLFPLGESACPKCRAAFQRAMRDHHNSGEKPHTAAFANRKKRHTFENMTIAESKLKRLGSLTN